jgi:hypothetical protein
MPREGRWGWTRTGFGIYIPLPSGTGAVEVVTDAVLGYITFLEKVFATVAVAGTGSGASRVVNVLKGASTVMATHTLVLAEVGTVGAVVPFTVTDDGGTNMLEDADTLTVEFPTAGAVAFTAGAINLYLGFRTRPQQK